MDEYRPDDLPLGCPCDAAGEQVLHRSADLRRRGGFHPQRADRLSDGLVFGLRLGAWRGPRRSCPGGIAADLPAARVEENDPPIDARVAPANFDARPLQLLGVEG